MKYKVGDILLHKEAKYYMRITDVVGNKITFKWSDNDLKDTASISEIENLGWYKPTKLHKALL